jgi:hypothetical protein
LAATAAVFFRVDALAVFAVRWPASFGLAADRFTTGALADARVLRPDFRADAVAPARVLFVFLRDFDDFFARAAMFVSSWGLADASRR